MANAYWKKWYSKNKEHFKSLVNKHKQNRRKRFQEIINQYKDKPCIVCGESFDPCVMEFSHKDGTEKKFRISDAGRKIYSIDKLVEEIEKCDVICACCNRIIKTEEYLKSKDEPSRNRRRTKLRAVIDNVKSEPCKDCGKTFPPYCMDLDHLDADDKVDSLSSMLSSEKNLEEIVNELSKVESVCVNCHRVRTCNRKKESSEKTKKD